MKAIVLTTNNKSSFLNELGMSTASRFLCMHVTPTKIFDFQVFNLMSDKKIIDYIKTKNGLIIIINYSDLNINTTNTINQIIHEICDIPIMIKIENSNIKDVSNIENIFKHLIGKSNIKLFYENNEPKQIMYDGIDYEAKTWFNDIITK